MSFYLRKDARDWFKGIRPSLDIDFDSYYFCLMAGIATRRKLRDDEVKELDTSEIVQYFPGEYQAMGRLIIALFLRSELAVLGISLEERTAVHDAIHRFINPTSPSGLSDGGEKEINKYAHAGFEVLTEWFDDRPRTLETFLPLYKRHLDSALSAHD